VGLLEKYKQFRKRQFERSVAKNLKLIQNAKAIKEERVGAIDFFRSIEEVEIAVPSLLKRFDYSLEHGINDTREKESAMAGILDLKEKALPYVKAHLLQTTRIAWPLKIYNKLGTEEQVIEVLEACLDYNEVSFDQTKVDKNYDLLCHLRDHRLPDGGRKLLHFVKYLDERVRFASVEAIVIQGVQDVVKELEHFLTDDSAENTRIRQSLIDAYIQNKWIIKNREIVTPGILAPGVKVSSSYQVEGV
jgi:hypothetical protein